LRLHLAALSDIEEQTAKNSKAKVMNIFNLIFKLRIGEALLFAPSAVIDVEENEQMEDSVKRLGTGYLKIKVRARITEDGGKSVTANAVKKPTFGTTTKIATSGSMFGATTAIPSTSMLPIYALRPSQLHSLPSLRTLRPIACPPSIELGLVPSSPSLVLVLQTLQLLHQFCQVPPLPRSHLNQHRVNILLQSSLTSLLAL
jgi:hypothetical protein